MTNQETNKLYSCVHSMQEANVVFLLCHLENETPVEKQICCFRFGCWLFARCCWCFQSSGFSLFGFFPVHFIIFVVAGKKGALQRMQYVISHSLWKKIQLCQHCQLWNYSVQFARACVCRFFLCSGNFIWSIYVLSWRQDNAQVCSTFSQISFIQSATQRVIAIPSKTRHRPDFVSEFEWFHRLLWKQKLIVQLRFDINWPKIGRRLGSENGSRLEHRILMKHFCISVMLFFFVGDIEREREILSQLAWIRSS